MLVSSAGCSTTPGARVPCAVRHARRASIHFFDTFFHVIKSSCVDEKPTHHRAASMRVSAGFMRGHARSLTNRRRTSLSHRETMTEFPTTTHGFAETTTKSATTTRSFAETTTKSATTTHSFAKTMTEFATTTHGFAENTTEFATTTHGFAETTTEFPPIPHGFAETTNTEINLILLLTYAASSWLPTSILI
jgi:adenine-specific DNA glycosylase